MSSECDKKVQYSILLKYFEDKASLDEYNIVQSWFNNQDNNIQIENCLRLLWNEMDPDVRNPDVDLTALLHQIHHTINLTEKKEKIRSLPQRSKSVFPFKDVIKNMARVAAVLLLPLMAYLGWEVYSQKMWIKNQSEIVYNEIICPLGTRSQFELPDGTKGTLNNGSKLKYPVKFYGDTREVKLVGEAFFDVYHHKNKPFVINTDGLDVKVLGTRLNVYSYPEEGFQEFTLESGSIELIKEEDNKKISLGKMKPGQHVVYRYKDSKVDLDLERLSEEYESVNRISSKEELEEFLLNMNPSQYAVYESEEGNLNIKFDEPHYYTSWKDGKLVLRNDPMPSVLKRIERWYNVNFNILDERINEYTYWATFEEENLDQVLKLLSLSGPFEFKKHDIIPHADGTYKAQEIDVMFKN